MKAYAADDARRRLGEVLKEAGRAPVEITRHGRRARYVLMSREAYDVYEGERRAYIDQLVVTTVKDRLARLLVENPPAALQLIDALSGAARRAP